MQGIPPQFCILRLTYEVIFVREIKKFAWHIHFLQCGKGFESLPEINAKVFLTVNNEHRGFEIIYVVGSEEDVVGVRTGHRNERVYLYPTIATPAQARDLFNLLAANVNDIYESPRMYNTLTHNCTNELTRPVEKMSDVTFPLTWKTILPGYFDEILHELQLIDTNQSFAEMKQSHLINNESVDVTKDTYTSDLRMSIRL